MGNIVKLWIGMKRIMKQDQWVKQKDLLTYLINKQE
jgi:hypothetical protein